ncbi:hypothetical protein B566_EDAN011994 [Ephemera danica]|nr:hypothetical protein B566_EDAN011994 [Ephemera danica]
MHDELLDQVDVVRTLLSAGADPGVQNVAGENALDAAGTPHMRQIFVDELLRATGNSEVGRVCQLVAAGLSINSYDSIESRNTPLHWAASYGNRDIVSCLIDRGANVNAMNSCGATPLHDAVSQNCIEIVEELLQGGANPLIQAMKGKFSGQTPLDLARSKPDLVELVERFTSFNTESTRRVSIAQEMNGGALSDGSGRLRAASVRSISSDMFDVTENMRKVSQTSVAPMTPLNQTIRDPFDHSPHFDQVTEKLSRGQLQAPILPLVTRTSLQLLWPQPHRIQELAGPNFMIEEQLKVSVQPGSEPVHKILDVWEVNRTHLQSLGFDVMVGGVQTTAVHGRNNENCKLECCVNAVIFPSANSYQLHITASKIRVTAGSLRALHHALLTLAQLIRLSSSEDGLAPVLIQDYPQMQHRGVLLDISPHSRIPALDYLFHMIELWSQMKMSHLHLYTRLQPSSEWQLSYTASEVVSITRYCQDRFITLVPVLDVEECVELVHLPSMWLAFQKYITSFPDTNLVHVGPRLGSLLLSSGPEDGTGGLAELWHLLSLPPTTTLLLCCNNLAPTYPLPANVILVEYGFQADYDFLGRTKPFLDQGRAVCLCPGTASWNSLAGCPEAALCNVLGAVQVASQTNVLGVIVALWSGPHHLTPHSFAWPGFVVGAGLSWNTSTHWEFVHSSLASLLDTHVFLDTAGRLGQVVLELGYADTLSLRAARNQPADDQSQLPDPSGSTLHCLLTDPDNVSLENLSPDMFAKVTKHVKRCQGSLLRARLQCAYAEMVLQELQLTADLMITACR